MIQHIGALADQRGAVAPDALDDRLDRLLAEFLCDLGLAARQQLRRIGAGRVGAAAGFDDPPEPVKSVAKRVGQRLNPRLSMHRVSG